MAPIRPVPKYPVTSGKSSMFHSPIRLDREKGTALTGIWGNEIADQLAKDGRENKQPPSHLSYREVKPLIRYKKKAIFHGKTGGYNPNQDALHQLPRHQQTIIFRLRTGHYRRNSHLKRISVKTSAQCPSGQVDQLPCGPAHSTTKQGSRYGPHVCP